MITSDWQDIKCEDIEWPVRVQNVLKNNGIHTLGQLVRVPSDVPIKEWVHFGRRSYNTVKEELSRMHLWLGMTEGDVRASYVREEPKPTEEPMSVTATVTERRAVLLRVIQQTNTIKKLTAQKLTLLDELTEGLHNELRRSYDHDQERLHRLEQAIQRLENAASGGRAAVSDGPTGEAPSGG